MALIAKEKAGGSGITPVEAGTYPARCCGVVDLGLQRTEWQGQVKEQEKVLLMFELPTERVTVEGEDKPRWLSQRLTVSLHEKSVMRKTLDAWRGKPMTADELKGFNIGSLLNAPCMLNVVNKEGSNGNVYANIGGIGKPMKGIPIPELESEPILFDMDADDAEEVFKKLPEWVQNVIDESVTWKERKATFKAADDDEGELPW